MAFNLKNRSFLTLLDYSPKEIRFLLSLAESLKKSTYTGNEVQRLKGKKIALIFEKTSTRTRCAFETAAFDQGASVTYLGPGTTQMGAKETMKDTARVLGRMYDGIEYRGFEQKKVELLAEYSGVPVWNGLTDRFHPTQVLADFQTILEQTDKPLSEVKLAYLGDARNNMGNSLLISAAKLGVDFRSVAPAACQQEPDMIGHARKIASETGAKLTITEDIAEGVRDCDFIYTDVWVSMGEPESVWQERIKQLLPYQVNADVIRKTGNPGVKFLHCLPAFHNRATDVGENIYRKYGLEAMEVTEEVFESSASVVFDQAENRVHTIKAVMVATAGT